MDPSELRVWEIPKISNEVRAVRDVYGSRWNAHHQAEPFSHPLDRQFWSSPDEPGTWVTGVLMLTRGPLTEVVE